jgi:predicted Ser/Thr protein kinase
MESGMNGGGSTVNRMRENYTRLQKKEESSRAYLTIRRRAGQVRQMLRSRACTRMDRRQKMSIATDKKCRHQPAGVGLA